MIGIIGGTGMDTALAAAHRGDAREIDTPFGPPSAPIVVTEVDGVEVALLARHGLGHRFNPTRVPYRANIFALKRLGVTQILATGAVGSLRDDVAPRHLVVPDQIIDRTVRRPSTFFEDLAVHVELGSPFCERLRRCLLDATGGGDLPVHDRATYVCMEGPQLSTRAESELHRRLGGDLIGMTAQPEAKLAREAEICYALLALPTDYDCWRPHPPELAAPDLLKEIIGNLQAVTTSAMALVRRALPQIADGPGACACQTALSLAVWTDREHVPTSARRSLEPLLRRYLATAG